MLKSVIDHYFRLHQAAVGVVETKRQQDVAAATVSAIAASGDVDDGEAGSGDAPTGDRAPEGSDAATVAARDRSDTDDVKPARRRGRQKGKSAAAADDANPASKPAVDTLSPAQLAETVQDKAVAS